VSAAPGRDDEFSAIAADDALLDALGRGEPAPGDDKLAGLMATWRADLDEGPAEFDPAAIVARLADEPALVSGADLSGEGPSDLSGDGPSGNGAKPVRTAVPVPPVRPRRWRPGRRAGRYLSGVAAALVLVAGLAVGAGTAGPESPLWPIARVLYPERAEVRLAEHTIALAREAAADGRYADAHRSLDRAAGTVRRIDDPRRADRLRTEIDRIRRSLPSTGVPGVPAPPSPSVPVPVPVPPTAQPTRGGGQPGGGQPDGGQPGGGGTRQPGGGIVPGLPTPTLPVPVPTVPIPPVPGLPTGPGL
jgi:hypothetical protein